MANVADDRWSKWQTRRRKLEHMAQSTDTADTSFECTIGMKDGSGFADVSVSLLPETEADKVTCEHHFYCEGSMTEAQVRERYSRANSPEDWYIAEDGEVIESALAHMTQSTQALDMARKPYVEVSGTWRNCPEDTFEGYKVSIGWDTLDTVWDDDYFFSCNECTSRAAVVVELTNVHQDFCIPVLNISEVMYELDEA